MRSAPSPTLLALAAGALAACESEPAPAPLRAPASAFVPRTAAGCPTDYNAHEATCVHRAHVADPALLAHQLRDYERGARAPLVAPASALPEASPVPNDPGSLSARVRPDPAAAHARRLAALDGALARLRERERDGAARSPGRAGHDALRDAGTHDGERSDSASFASKLGELRHLVQRLPEHDTAVLTEQLRRDGFTEDELRGLVPTAR